MSATPPAGLKKSEMWPGFWIGPEHDRIGLYQESRKGFELRSTIWFGGDIGIDVDDPEVEDRLRIVSPESLPDTDLASVPAPFRWWVNSYGLHTPAALIHDRFIGAEEEIRALKGVTEQQIDRYFRYMLGALGIGVVRRWLIWSAVAVRTRLVSGLVLRVLFGLWAVAMLIGLFLTYRAIFEGGSWWLPLLLPLAAASLWGRQWGAGVAIAYLGIPTLLVPSLLAVLGIFGTALLDALGFAIRELRNAWRDVGGPKR